MSTLHIPLDEADPNWSPSPPICVLPILKNMKSGYYSGRDALENENAVREKVKE